MNSSRTPEPLRRDKRIKALLPLLSLLLLLPPLYLHYRRSVQPLPQPLRLQGFLDSQRDRESLQNTDVSSRSLFVAFGQYTTLPRGAYRALFRFTLPERAKGGEFLLEIASFKGSSVEASKRISLSTSSTADLTFRLSSSREVEPRALSLSGPTGAVLESVDLLKVADTVPWSLYIPLLLGGTLLLSLLLLALWRAWTGEGDFTSPLNLILFLAALFFILQRAWISEDSLISLRHVDNLLGGHGPVFNPVERVEGFSHVLWFWILVPFRLFLPPRGALIVPSLLFSGLALGILFFRLSFSRCSREGRVSWGGALLLGTVAFLDFSTGGLETPLAFFLLAWTALLVSRGEVTRRPLTAGLLCALLPLTRPDFLVFTPFLLLPFLAERPFRFRSLLTLLAPPALLVGGYQIFRMGYYGALLPNPFFAKSGSGSHWLQGFHYLEDFCVGSPALLLLPLLALVFFSPRGRLRRRRLLLMAAGSTHLLFVLRGGGDFMHGRFLLPGFFLLALSVQDLFRYRFLSTRPFRLLALFLLLSLPLLHRVVLPVQQRGRTFHYGISDERAFYYKNQEAPFGDILRDRLVFMWKTIGQNYGKIAEGYRIPLRIAYMNVGFTGYYAGPRVTVFDRLGLTDPVVARRVLLQRGRPGHEKSAPFAYLIHRRLTFGETPFPLWNRAALTEGGILWDLSPRTLRSLSPLLPPRFKENLDGEILRRLASDEAVRSDREFLFFLSRFWAPFAPGEGRRLLVELGEGRGSQGEAWIGRYASRIEAIDAHLRSPLTASLFFENLRFALKESWKIDFLPQEELHE